MFWVCVGAIREGLGIAEVRPLLADEQNRGGKSYRGRLSKHGTQHGDAWLERYVWPRAEQFAERGPGHPANRAEAELRIEAITRAIELTRWTGTGGATNRALLIAVVARGRDRGSLTPTMSHREMAEATPCSRRTAGEASRRLVALGWLQVVRKGGGTTERREDGLLESARATRWRLRIPPGWSPARTFAIGGTPIASTSLNGASAREARAALDACRWRGLGLNSPRVLDALSAAPATATELAQALGLDRGNLRSRLLPRLESFGLLERRDEGRWAVVENLAVALETAAADLGLSGKADTVAAVHAADREGYLAAREEGRARRQLARRAKVAAELAARRPKAPDHLPDDLSLRDRSLSPSHPPSELPSDPSAQRPVERAHAEAGRP